MILDLLFQMLVVLPLDARGTLHEATPETGFALN
jgi:hypothetical protein